MTRAERLLAAVVMVAVTSAAPVAPAAASVEVRGAGSTWSQIAVDQWRADVARQGLSINYGGGGSTVGRNLYRQDQVDFAVSEIPFQTAYTTVDGSVTLNEVEEAAHRPYAYMPVVAGGTAFMYNVTSGGNKVRDLKLSAATIAKIFTGKIVNWNHAEITADNGGRALPDLKITPVIRSDGSGTTAQFTAWMASQTVEIWSDFCRSKGLPAQCPPTSQYPPFDGSRAQQASDGVANYVAAPYNNGAITYVEYGYALARSFPVASVLNQAGFFTQPTAENVAIALMAARINADRTQVLAGVYTNPDPRAYPVSSYSYMIVPTTTAKPFTTEKGETLGKFVAYFLCTGQQKAKQLGYSPLPRNLVEFGFEAMSQIPGAPPPPPIEQCANPTITGNFTENLENAPPPPASARQGAAPGDAANPGTPGAPAAAGTPAAAAAAKAATAKAGAAAAKAGAAGVGVADPGGTVPAGDVQVGVGTEATTGDPQLAAAVSVEEDDGVATAPFLLAGLVLLLIVFLPPALAVLRPAPSNRATDSSADAQGGG